LSFVISQLVLQGGREWVTLALVCDNTELWITRSELLVIFYSKKDFFKILRY